MESVSRDRRVLHLVRGAILPAELADPPPGHTVCQLPAPGAEAELDAWDRILDLVAGHDVVVTW
jgi:hypothetical protein